MNEPKTFSELGLIEPLLKAVQEEGYTTPTPIQDQTIPSILMGKDILGCAQTGTGKTAAFTLPILQYLWNNKRVADLGSPRVLILAPTRELAAQIGESVKVYGRHLRLSHTTIFGGVSAGNQIRALHRGVDILVATPGRLLDLMGQGHIKLSDVEIFVLDEADRMLDMGFMPDVKRIIGRLPHKKQSLFFSATLVPEVISLAKTLVHDPVHVTITPESPTVDRIKQSVYFIDKEHKDTFLFSLLQDPSINRVMVFTLMKHTANKLEKTLRKQGIKAAAIHGNKSQNARIHALDSFRDGKMRVLVATDIAARGIDIDGVTHVINYDLPNEPESYVHRIGRTARAGAEGDAISLCSAPERDFLRAIERLIKKPIPVVMDHPFHSERAMNAIGAAARPPPKHGRDGNRFSHGGYQGQGNRGGFRHRGPRRETVEGHRGSGQRIQRHAERKPEQGHRPDTHGKRPARKY